jgi:hypothetical protein
MAAPPGAATFAYDVDFLIFCTDQVVCIEKNCYLYIEICAKE